MGLFDKLNKNKQNNLKLKNNQKNSNIESDEESFDLLSDYPDEIDESFDVVNLFSSNGSYDKPVQTTSSDDIDLDFDENEKLDYSDEINDDFDVASLFKSEKKEAPKSNFDKSMDEDIDILKQFTSSEPKKVNIKSNDSFKEPIIEPEIPKEPVKPSFTKKSSLLSSKKSLNLDKEDIFKKMNQKNVAEEQKKEEKKQVSTFVSIDENYIGTKYVEIKEEPNNSDENLFGLEPDYLTDSEINAEIEIPEDDFSSEIKTSTEELTPEIIIPEEELSVEIEIPKQENNIKESVKEESKPNKAKSSFDDLFSLFDEVTSSKKTEEKSLLDLFESEVEEENNFEESENSLIEPIEEPIETEKIIEGIVKTENKDSKPVVIEPNKNSNPKEFESVKLPKQSSSKSTSDNLSSILSGFLNSEPKKEEIHIEEVEEISNEFETVSSDSINSSYSDFDIFSLIGQNKNEFTQADQEENLKSSEQVIIAEKDDCEENNNSIYEIDEDEINRQENLLDEKIIEDINSTIEENSSNELSAAEIFALSNHEEEPDETLSDLLESQDSDKLDRTLDNFETSSNNYLKEKRKGLLKSSGLLKGLKKPLSKEIQEVVEENEEIVLDKKAFISIDEEIDSSLFKEREKDYSKLNESFNPYLGKTEEEIAEMRRQRELDIQRAKEKILYDNSFKIADIPDDLLDGNEQKDSSDINELLKDYDTSEEVVNEDIEENKTTETQVVIKPHEELVVKTTSDFDKYNSAINKVVDNKAILIEFKVIKESVETIDFSIFNEYAEFVKSYRKLRKDYLVKKKADAERKRKKEQERQIAEKERLLAEKQALMEQQLTTQNYHASNQPTLLGNVSLNSRDRLMKLRQDVKNAPDEDTSLYGIRANDQDILLSELNSRLPRRALYDEFIDDKYEEQVETEYVSPNKNTFAVNSMRPPEKRGTFKNRGFEEGYRKQDD